ncbi:MAG: hypothetical protein PHW98_02565 [Candidatus Omnitrophica bacterium]|nr:hypothetical protein [Candidatus Omnitrophota bacterium]MDD5770888.1 hypothetical protein [Candidatus Omnitrophota bacterium]
MKKAFFVLMALCFIGSLAFAQEVTQSSDTAPTPEPIGLVGYIVDTSSLCANLNNMDKFLKTYSKEDALKPENLNRGYSVYANNQGFPLNKESSAKIGEFLKDPNNGLKVRVSARQDGEALNVVSIENRE